MLIPRYSIRWLLGLTTFSAGVSLVLSYAVRGHAWAIGVTSALWTFIVVGVFYVVAFLGAWLISQRNTAPHVLAGESPFAGAAPESPPPTGLTPADSPPPMTG